MFELLDYQLTLRVPEDLRLRGCQVDKPFGGVLFKFTQLKKLSRDASQLIIVSHQTF